MVTAVATDLTLDRGDMLPSSVPSQEDILSFATTKNISRRGLTVTVALLSVSVTASSSRAQDACPDVEVLFARGSGELPGLGIVGEPLVDAITNGLSELQVSAYAVEYLADLAQTSAGSGADDMTSHLVATAERCPDTLFVVGGYSQGGSVTDIAIDIPTVLGIGDSIPAQFQDRIRAVVVFGNPLALFGDAIMDDAKWGSRAREFCNFGDPVCGAGVNVLAHLTYGFDGSADEGAAFAVEQVRASRGAP